MKFILILVGIIGLMATPSHANAKNPVSYGLFFSPLYATELGLDWKETYLSILSDLGVKNLRLPSYWNRIEKIQGELDFSELDYMLKQAAEHKATVSLVLGNKQPRWPECHTPEWALKLEPNQRQDATLKFIEAVVERYKSHPEIVSWQVENEPFFPFGPACPTVSQKFLSKEVGLVRKIDPTRPIILTDSGEWRLSGDLMRMADTLGISLYRRVYNDLFRGYITYPFPSRYYPLKDQLVRFFTGTTNRKTIITELQAEPWFTDLPLTTPIATHLKLFPPQQLKDNLAFAEKTGFEEIYLWGVEWWYFMKINGHPEYWQIAKELFK